MNIINYKRSYILSDFLAAALCWGVFFIFRKYFIESKPPTSVLSVFHNVKFFLGVVLIPAFWCVLSYAAGYYNNILRKTRVEDFAYTLVVTLIGSVFVFFIFILDDYVGSYKQYYELFGFLFLALFVATLVPRLLLTSHILRQERKGKIIFSTVLIGKEDCISQIWKEMEVRFPGHGHRPLGYIVVEDKSAKLEEMGIQKIASFADIHDTIKQHPVTDVIIALESSDSKLYDQIIYELNSSHVVVKINPELYPIAKKQVIISSLFHYPLIQVSRDLQTPWQASLKLLIDMAGAITGLILSLPACIVLAIAIKLTSKGPIIYSHERIGKFGKPFKIYKFRSMRIDAETTQPLLATDNDPRITPVGRIMRKLKLDEIPNFFNVLKGDMSLVGPRPERKFFIDQIVKRAPEYTRLLKVKPGITSWGQVKYGYASTVDEMLRRLRYDMLYIENMSLYVDFQILTRTIIIIFGGNNR